MDCPEKPAVAARPLRVCACCSALLLLVPGKCVLAQDSESLDKAAQNPIADMISVPFQNNTTLNAGPSKQTQNVLNIQPVYPIDLNPDWNVITRTIIPVVSQPDFGVPNAERENGLGDIQFTAFFSPKKTSPSGWTWGAGPILQMPSATEDPLGQGKWGLGPAVVALRSQKGSPWLYGVYVNNVWSVGGESDRRSVNQMFLQPLVFYNFPQYPGRYLVYTPNITADWKANGEKWTVPIGLGIGQRFKIGAQNVNVQAHAYYNVVRPDNVGNWTIRLNFQLLFPR